MKESTQKDYPFQENLSLGATPVCAEDGDLPGRHYVLPNGTRYVRGDNGGITWIDEICECQKDTDEYVFVAVRKSDASRYRGGGKKLVARREDGSIFFSAAVLDESDDHTLDDTLIIRHYGLARGLWGPSFRSVASNFMRLFLKGNYDYTRKFNVAIEDEKDCSFVRGPSAESCHK